MIDVDKQRTLDEFAKQNTGLRVLVVTDALAHGKDIPDVDAVVVYGFPRDKEPSILTQMLGRAARAPGHKGVAVLSVMTGQLVTTTIAYGILVHQKEVNKNVVRVSRQWFQKMNRAAVHPFPAAHHRTKACEIHLPESKIWTL